MAIILAFVAILALFLPKIRPASAAGNLEVNLFLPDAPDNINILDQYEKNLGVKFNSLKWYLDWPNGFTPSVAANIHNHGALPELTWEPQIGSQGIAFNDVISGKYDSYLNSFATSVKSLGYPIRINLAPEMNSNWVAWGIGLNGNTPTNEKSFWRYVVQKFQAQGASNVQWVWTPNIHYYGEPSSYTDLYPGDAYVTYLGLDGYNWGTSQSWSNWQTFSQVFRDSYNDLTKLSSKNILLMEVASSEAGGNKAAWITDMFSSLKSSFPKITGFYWFNINKETDWRIESSAASKTAFINAVKGIPNSSSISAGSTANSQSSSKNKSSVSSPLSNNSSNPNSPTPNLSSSNYSTTSTGTTDPLVKNAIAASKSSQPIDLALSDFWLIGSSVLLLGCLLIILIRLKPAFSPTAPPVSSKRFVDALYLKSAL